MNFYGNKIAISSLLPGCHTGTMYTGQCAANSTPAARIWLMHSFRSVDAGCKHSEIFKYRHTCSPALPFSHLATLRPLASRR